MDFGLDENYLSNLQFGFKKCHSTVDALSKFQNDVLCNLRQRCCTVAISLDVEKAFDRAYHKGIIFKLKNLGFDLHIIKLFRSFFDNRNFCIQLNDCLSDFVQISCGVPQGSILAPHLYNIFIYDFPHNFLNSTGILYADDSLLYAHHESPLEALKIVSRHLYKVKDFYDYWGIKINASKSEAICLRNASGKCAYYVVPESKRLKLFLNGIEIPFRDKFKYLGIYFNKLFKFNEHAKFVLNKVYKIKGYFGRILYHKSLPIRTKLLIYKTCLRPVLLYGFPIWFSISPTVMKKFEIFERNVLRSCIGKNFVSRFKRFSNIVIYKDSKVVPLGFYVINIINNYINRLVFHDNIIAREIIDSQRGYSWTNTPYLSPVGLQNETIVYNMANSLPDFFKQSFPGTHRG